MVRSYWMGLLMAMVAVPLWAAAPKKADEPKKDTKDWPRKAAIEAAEGRVEWEKDHTIKIEHKNKTVTFVPANINNIDDRHRESGMILGRLINEGKSDDNLEPGNYLVYVRKHEGNWQAFYVTKHEPVAKAVHCRWRDEKENKPSFEEHATWIRYWHLIFTW